MSARFGLPSRSIIGLALAMFAGGLQMPARAVAAQPRIVSMNVCTDQLLLPLADPEQILGLSRYSRNGWPSPAADETHRYPALSGEAEDVLVLKPDVVVATLFEKRSTRELLKSNGLYLVEFALPRNLEQVKSQIREMGEIAGHADRAMEEITRLDAAVARAHKAVAEKRYRVLPLARRGWVSGSDSFVSSLLTATGLLNAAGDLGVTSGGYASLEAIVNLKPDLILVSQAGDHAGDEGEALLLHPALERFYPPSKRIVIPEPLTECGSIRLAEALDVLVRELKRVEP
jgi:iron complex transport system substrate-binding protein